MALTQAADALYGLRRYREALILQDEAIEATEGEAAEPGGEEDLIYRRMIMYMNRIKMLRHLGRLDEAMATCVKAAPLLRSDMPGCFKSTFLVEAALLYEATGSLDVALDFDARGAAHDDRYNCHPDVVRRRALQLLNRGNRGAAIDLLRRYTSILDGEAQASEMTLFTTEGKLKVVSERMHATLQLLHMFKDLLRESGGGEDGRPPRHVADEIRQVRPLASASECLHRIPPGPAPIDRELDCHTRLTRSWPCVQVEKLVGQLRQRDEAERDQVLQQAREELLAGRAELRREQAARKKRADRRRRKRGKAKAQQQQQEQHQPPPPKPGQEAQEGQEEKGDETGPPPGESESDAAGAAKEEEGKSSWRDCSICLEALDEREAEGAEALRVEALASCPHSFHSGCLDLWVGRCAAKALASTCPDCRADINRQV
jgi:tetratricopeptide (TPR) repeat protein